MVNMQQGMHCYGPQLMGKWVFIHIVCLLTDSQFSRGIHISVQFPLQSTADHILVPVPIAVIMVNVSSEQCAW